MNDEDEFLNELAKRLRALKERVRELRKEAKSYD